MPIRHCLYLLVFLLLPNAAALAQTGGPTLPSAHALVVATRTFHTSGKQLLDPCGEAVVLRGVNKQVFFDATDPDGVRNFAQIALTKANCVRIVWQMRNDADGSPTSPARLDRIIANARRNRLIPIVGLWDFTGLGDGGFSRLAEYAAYWASPAVRAVVRKHRSALIINIGNEAGMGTTDGAENNADSLAAYANGYKAAIRTIRAAGITVPLIVDGMDRGKSAHCLAIKGEEILADDPRHNVIFSFHPYWPKSDTDTDPAFIPNKFAELASHPVCVVMGELASRGAWAGAATINVCSDAGTVDYQQFAQRAQTAGMGWMAWEWGPGGFWQTPGDCPALNMTTDGNLATLGTTAASAWAAELVTGTAPYSIASTARKSFFVRSAFKTCPVP